MKRGPKPTPRNMRLVKGNERPDRMNPDEPIVKVSIPEAPDYLDADEAESFVERAVILARMRVMTEADVDALAIYAVNFCRWKEAVSKYKEVGLLVKSSNGVMIQNAYIGIANKSQAEMIRILTEFGMTPSSRTRVQAK